MRVVNKTRRKSISNDGRLIKNIFGKALGLMFSFSPKTLVFEYGKEQLVPLHMFFVFFPIDVIYLNAGKRVVETASLKPFTFYNPKEKAKYVVELPAGTITATKTKKRDVIGFED